MSELKTEGLTGKYKAFYDKLTPTEQELFLSKGERALRQNENILQYIENTDIEKGINSIKEYNKLRDRENKTSFLTDVDALLEIYKEDPTLENTLSLKQAITDLINLSGLEVEKEVLNAGPTWKEKYEKHVEDFNTLVENNRNALKEYKKLNKIDYINTLLKERDENFKKLCDLHKDVVLSSVDKIREECLWKDADGVIRKRDLLFTERCELNRINLLK